MVNALIEFSEAWNGICDQGANTIVIGHDPVPVQRVLTKGRRGNASDDCRFRALVAGKRAQLTERRMHHAERVFHGDGLWTFPLHVDVGAAQARQNQRVLAMDQVTAIQLGADLHGQVAVTQCLRRALRIRCSLGEVAAQADEDLGAPFEHRMDRLDHIVAVVARHREFEALLDGVQQRHGRALVDAHGAVALHVAVATYWAQACPRHTDVAAQQHQVDDFLNGRHRVAVLGDSHGPAHDHALAAAVHASRQFDVFEGQAGLRNDVIPGRGIDHLQVSIHAVTVLRDESMVENGFTATGLRFALPLQQELGHAAHHRHIAAQGWAEKGSIGRTVAVGEHLQHVLRVLEALQTTLAQGVDAHHLGATFHSVA